MGKRARLAAGAVVATVALSVGGVASADSGVVGYWHFDEGSGIAAADASGIGNNGVLSGGVSWAPGVTGNALSFDGLTGQVRVPDTSSLEPAQVTVQAWVRRPGSPGNFKYVADKGYAGCIAGSYGLYTGSNGGLVFYVSSGGGSNFTRSPDVGPAIWDGNWHLAAGTYDGASVRLFVDGVEVGSGTASTGGIGYALPNSNDLFFGAYLGCDGLDYPGVIDEPEIWNRALSPGEIKAQFPYPKLTLSPLNATITYGGHQSYAAEGFDAHASDVGDVTAQTSFAISPDGACAAAICTPAAVGTHSITGTDGASSGSAALVVAPAPLRVAANSATRPYGAANPPLSATISGFVNGQTLATSGVTGAPACSTTATPASQPGGYPIRCTQSTLAAGNYSFPAAGFVLGTLTVVAAPTSLTAPTITVIGSVLTLGPTFTATLVSQATGAPVAGQTTAFTLSGAPRSPICSGVTDAAGVAECEPGPLAVLPLLASRSYAASFGGATDYLASSRTAAVIIPVP